jgi:hypothetical protein
MYGAQEELRRQVLKLGFSMGYEQKEREEQGPLVTIHGMDDVSEMPWKRKIDLQGLDREEDYEEFVVDKQDELGRSLIILIEDKNGCRSPKTSEWPYDVCTL